MKNIGLVALFFVLGMLAFVFSAQTHFFVDSQTIDEWNTNPFEKGRDQIRKPSSVKELPKAEPTQELKYEIIPDDFPWNEEGDYKSRIRLVDLHHDVN